jgi:hypothetical protein
MLKLLFVRQDLVIREIVAETIAIAAILTLFFLTRRYVSTCFSAAERGLRRIATRQGLSVTLIGLVAVGSGATLSLVGQMPHPRMHDEFSYMLAADTFVHGRLSNPTHPLWVHFESMHIIQEPTYASKYPPGQGLMLAAGQLIGGHPIVGVWISTGLACAAIYWMLLAWLRPCWALLGSLFAALHPGVLPIWGQSYWSGNVAVIGGALVFGGVRRVMRRPCMRDSLVLGLGLAILANSRPYEGLVASLPLAFVLLAWMLGKKGPAIQISIKRIALPVVIILALAGGAMTAYNLRVTGDALNMPYLLHESTYAMAPFFLWQSPRPAPMYRHEILRFHHLRALEHYANQWSARGFAAASVEKLKSLWKFYNGSRGIRLVLTVPLLMLPWVLRNRWMRFALLTCAVLFAGLGIETWAHPHYAAPIAGLVCALVLQAMRHLRLWHRHGRLTGRLIVWAFGIVTIASFIVTFVQQVRVKAFAWESERARIVAPLKQDGKRHLIIVPQGPLHPEYDKRLQEWVYNDADIDGAKVVWAREMDAAQNRKLLDYFKDREVWLLTRGENASAPKLVSYPAELQP